MKWWKRASSPDESERVAAAGNHALKEKLADREEDAVLKKEVPQQEKKADAKFVRRHYVVSGRVQGVGFRYTAYQVANSYGLTGWVRNCYDGTVEMEVQGPEGLVSTFLKQMQLMNKWMRIEHVKGNDISVINESGFQEKY